MSFTKLSYDQGSYKTHINESVGPGVYQINSPPISCEACYPYPPSSRLQKRGVSVSKNYHLIDINSELRGITRKLSQDPSKQYNPKCVDSVCTSGEVCGQGVVGNCIGLKPGSKMGDNELEHFKDCTIPAENSRLSNPSCNLRGTGWNRWEWLCVNPQERVEIPFDYNISNRIIVKDNHRPCIPIPIDPAPLLPKGGDLPCEPTQLTCAAFTQPNSTHWANLNTLEKL